MYILIPVHLLVLAIKKGNVHLTGTERHCRYVLYI